MMEIAGILEHYLLTMYPAYDTLAIVQDTHYPPYITIETEILVTDDVLLRELINELRSRNIVPVRIEFKQMRT